MNKYFCRENFLFRHEGSLFRLQVGAEEKYVRIPCRERAPSRLLFLFGLTQRVLLVCLLKESEGLLPFPILRDEPFAVVPILQLGNIARGGSEVHEDPGN